MPLVTEFNLFLHLHHSLFHYSVRIIMVVDTSINHFLLLQYSLFHHSVRIITMVDTSINTP